MVKTELSVFANELFICKSTFPTAYLNHAESDPGLFIFPETVFMYLNNEYFWNSKTLI